MASSSSNPSLIVEDVEEHPYPNPYPYPQHVFVPSFVTVKLSGRDNYSMWKTQMECLLVSHDMMGFIEDTFVCPKDRTQSGKEKVVGIEGANYRRLWLRSDALVKGWILASLSEQTLKYVVDLLTAPLHQPTNTNFTAKNAWDKLQSIYGPPLLTSLKKEPEEEKIKREAESRIEGDSISEEVKPEDKEKERAKTEAEKQEKEAVGQQLYTYTLNGSWEAVERILKQQKVTATDKITIEGDTALHVAVGTGKKSEFIKRMLVLVPADRLLDMKNSDGSTVLHVAAMVGNTNAARMLVVKNRTLLSATDNDGCTPLFRALSNMHMDMFGALFDPTEIEMGKMFPSTRGDELLVKVISSKRFWTAAVLVRYYYRGKTDAVLMAIAQNFPTDPVTKRRRVHKIWDKVCGLVRYVNKTINTLILHTRENIRKLLYYTCGLGAIFLLVLVVFMGLGWLTRAVMMLLVLPFRWFADQKTEDNEAAKHLLSLTCDSLKNSNPDTSHHLFYTNPVLEATRLNAFQVVECIVNYFPNAIYSFDEDGHNIIQCAVRNRSEEVYNLLYQMNHHKTIYKTIKDSSGDNLLHLAARLAPANKLALISGAALQIQRELQWFQEVKGFVSPLYIIQKNYFGETPRMVFTREHKDLVIEGEKWMKATAESYTITAALITTVVFAAAITVPGGNNQDSGIPIFTTDTAFTIFAVSDAVSLFTSTTSLLMFLSILTARFAEQDFLFKLPTKLIIGLVTLFISTAAMIIAFGATLFLVFGQNKSWILFPIAALTSQPIISFVALQFRLIVDLMSSTYGSSIFGKKSNHPF